MYIWVWWRPFIDALNGVKYQQVLTTLADWAIMSQTVFLWVTFSNRGGDLTCDINVLLNYYCSYARSESLRNICSQMDQMTSLTWLIAYFPVGMMSYFLLYAVFCFSEMICIVRFRCQKDISTKVKWHHSTGCAAVPLSFSSTVCLKHCKADGCAYASTCTYKQTSPPGIYITSLISLLTRIYVRILCKYVHIL